MSVNAGVSAYYRRVQRGMDGFLKQEADHAGRLATKKIAANTPVGRIIDAQTGMDLGPDGKLRRGWKQIKPRKDSTGTWTSGASNAVSYTRIVEDGARAHMIIPRGGSHGGRHVLRFWKEHQLVFARRVKHPGVKGHFMMRRGLLEAGRQYAQEAPARYQRFLDSKRSR